MLICRQTVSRERIKETKLETIEYQQGVRALAVKVTENKLSFVKISSEHANFCLTAAT